MQDLIPYLPTDRRHALARGESLADRCQGAALFIDISGFTPLAEALGQEFGPQRGAEELTQYLNQVYDALIADLDRHRGSVVGFSGDAMTCWFEADDGLAATACALQMQQTMQQFGAIRLDSGGEFPLSAKGGVAVGTARRFVVGDPELQLIDVLAGSLLDEMAQAEHQASGGEVVLAPSAVSALGERVKLGEQRLADDRQFGLVLEVLVEPQREPWPELSGDSLGEEHVRPWLLGPVFERLRSGQGEFLAELRPAVALFLKFEGLDYDGDERAGGKLDEFIRRVQQILAGYEGTLVDITTGDKGSYLYMAFGAPIAHEDDVERAASAALDLRAAAAAAEYLTTSQIGINRGRMRTGAYGGRTRRTYGVLGDATNLAARLMTAAQPGEILLTQSTADRVEDAFAWEDHPDITVKGKREPIAVVGLLSRSEASVRDRPARRHLLPMVGRERELEIIQEKIDMALEGRGQVVGITAEAGMGKSRLVAEAVRVGQAHGFSVQTGECKSYGTQSSYLVWRDVWRGLLKVPEALSPDDQISTLQRRVEQLDTALLPRLPLLGPLFGLEIPDNQLTGQLDAQVRKSSLESLLTDLLRIHAEDESLMIVLEDTHWIDALSSDLANVLAGALADRRVLILTAYRPEAGFGAADSPLTRWPHFSELELDHLPQESAEQWISVKLTELYGNEAAAPPEFTDRLLRQAEGNPFYIEEVLNYLKDHDISPGDSGALSAIDLPASLHSLVLSRMDELNERPRSVLRVASVFGRSFGAPELSGAYPALGSENSVAAGLVELGRKGFTEVLSESERSHAFKHGVIQEVAYESLSFEMRRRLHGDIGHFIERASETVPVDLLANHFFRGEVWPKALDYSLEHAHQAQAEFANEAAITAADHALESGSHLEAVPELERKLLSAHKVLGGVLTLVGRYEVALEHLKKATEMVDRASADPGVPDRRAQLMRMMADVRERQGDYEAALKLLEQALGNADESNPDLETARIQLMCAGIYHRQARNEDAVEWARRSIETSSALGRGEAEETRAQALYLQGAAFYRMARFEEALAVCRESLSSYESLGQLLGQARAYNNLAIVYSDLGRWEESAEAYAESLAINRLIGNVQEQGFVANNLGNIYLYRGDYDRASDLFSESRAIWNRIGAPLPAAVTLSNLAQVEIYRKQWDRAHDLLTESEAILLELESEDFLPELERRWAEYHLGVGELDRALARARRSAELADQQEAQLEVGISLRVLGSVEFKRGEHHSAKAALLQSLDVLSRLKSEYEAAKTKAALAELAAASAELEGDRYLDEAISTFRRLGAQADLERASLLTG